jgi:hypothetical protein
MSGDAATVTFRLGSSQALITAKGKGFSLYPIFRYQTGNAYENPNPFFPETQHIK